MAQKLVDTNQQLNLFYASMDSPIGKLVLESDGDAIVSIHIDGNGDKLPNLQVNTTGHLLPACLELCKIQLREYFQGSREQFDLPLSPKGTPFQKKVWSELQRIPFGKTISYLELARLLGDPKVIRASASANGKNPIAIIIPCHRVIGTNGSLVGYAGGLANKKWLLDFERKKAKGISQLSIF